MIIIATGTCGSYDKCEIYKNESTAVCRAQTLLRSVDIYNEEYQHQIDAAISVEDIRTLIEEYNVCDILVLISDTIEEQDK